MAYLGLLKGLGLQLQIRRVAREPEETPASHYLGTGWEIPPEIPPGLPDLVSLTYCRHFSLTTSCLSKDRASGHLPLGPSTWGTAKLAVNHSNALATRECNSKTRIKWSLELSAQNETSWWFLRRQEQRSTWQTQTKPQVQAQHKHRDMKQRQHRQSCQGRTHWTHEVIFK